MASYASGKITREVAKEIAPFTLVKLNEDGKVEPNDESTKPYGHVEYKRVPKADTLDFFKFGEFAAVDTDAVIAKVEVDGNAADFKVGDPVYAAKEGKVATAGTVQVGTVHKVTEDAKVRVQLFGNAINNATS